MTDHKPAPAADVPSPGTSRSRGRVIAVAVLVVAVAASGVILDKAGPKAARVGTIAGTETGAWFCPHGGGLGWHGWVVVTNPGTRDVSIRTTSYTKSGAGNVSTFTVGPRHQVYREVAATDPASATEVEYFGGWVGVAAVVQGARSTKGLAGERCASGPRKTWFLLDEPTGRGETAYAVVMNPFDAPAQFDVVIRTERRTIDRRELTPFVLGPRKVAAIRINDFALEAPGETTVTAELVQRLGRVVAGTVGFGAGWLRADAGVSSLNRRWIIPGSDASTSGSLIVVNPLSGRADLTVIRQGPSIQEVLSGPDGMSLGPGGVLAYEVKDLQSGGVVVQSTNRARTAAALILTGAGDDSAGLGGTADPFPRWLVPPTVPIRGGTGVVILQNPGHAAAQVTLQAIGENGYLDLPGLGQVTVAAGRTLVVPLQTATGSPVSVVVTAQEGMVVASGSSSVADGAGYSATLGLPMPPIG
jgi:hypothetical protein